MIKQIELLAPGGDVNSIKAAIAAGADAVYCGLNKFNARNRATNISFDELNGVIHLAHKHQCKIFLTLNILILENEIPSLIQLLNQLVNTNIDGLIVQDLGLAYILSNYFKSIRIHASTQMTTHNKGQLDFLARLNIERVNLARELNLQEIKELTTLGEKLNLACEVFVHGSQCVSFSGICYMSSAIHGNSGNRGRCSQPCRDKYMGTQTAKEYPLNLKDNCAYSHIDELIDAGVSSLKIEGRIKKYDYIYTVVKTYKKQIENWQKHHKLLNEKEVLYKVFNRDLSHAYLRNEISKQMFIDHPRDYSILRLSKSSTGNTPELRARKEKQLYDEKDNIKQDVKNKIRALSINKIPLNIHIYGKKATPLRISVKTPDCTFDIASTHTLHDQGNEPLSYDSLFKRLKAINKHHYQIDDINLEGLEGELYLPFKELTAMKNQILYTLSGSIKSIAPVHLPPKRNSNNQAIRPTLSIIISSFADLDLLSDSETYLYYKLPSTFHSSWHEYTDVFGNESRLIPWFPSILIGEEYNLALDFLKIVQPKMIVTDNTGIAWMAQQMKIKWIAGPALNTVNSYSIQCLKEKFNCSGAFISNELGKIQIKDIHRPADFQLFYSIFHPDISMTSRQCFTQQTLGCYKTRVDANCIESCEKHSSITSSNSKTFFIEKSKGNYHRIYNELHYLNTAIVRDYSQKFDTFFIDLSDVKTKTSIHLRKSEIIHHFQQLLKGNIEAESTIHQTIFPTTHQQYKKGL